MKELYVIEIEKEIAKNTDQGITKKNIEDVVNSLSPEEASSQNSIERMTARVYEAAAKRAQVPYDPLKMEGTKCQLYGLAVKYYAKAKELDLTEKCMANVLLTSAGLKEFD